MGSAKYYRWQTYEKEEKTLRRKKKALVAIFIAFLGFLVWFLLFSQTFQVKNFVIKNNSKITQNDISQLLAAKNNLLGALKSNIFLISKEKLVSDLTTLFPDLYNIQVQKKFFNTLVINSNEREGIGIWCAQSTQSSENQISTSTISEIEDIDSCFYLDKEGVVFAFVPDNSGSLLFRIDEFAQKMPKLGDQIIEEATLEFLRGLRSAFLRNKIIISTFNIQKDKDINYIAKTGDGFEVYFDPQRSIEETVLNFEIVRKNVLKDNLNNLAYIDLRIPSRAFYKFKNAISNP